MKCNVLMLLVTGFLLVIITNSLFAQTTTNDQLHLKDGTRIVGKIVHYKVDQQVAIKLETGDTLTYDLSKVKRIYYQDAWSNVNKSAPANSSIDKIYLQDGSTIVGQLVEYIKAKEVTIQLFDGEWATYPVPAIKYLEHDKVRIELANSSTSKDQIYLLDGTIVVGSITRYQPKQQITVALFTGDTLSYAMTEVKGFYLGNHWFNILKRTTPEIVAVEKGWYGTVALGHALSTERAFPGVSIYLDLGGGYRLNQWLGIGIGGGMSADFHRIFVQCYGSLRGDFGRGFYTELAVGYSKLLSLNPLFGVLLERSGGGGYARPCLGWRLPSRRKTCGFIDLGLEVRSSVYTANSEDGLNEPAKKYTYTTFSPSVRVGILF